MNAHTTWKMSLVQKYFSVKIKKETLKIWLKRITTKFIKSKCKPHPKKNSKTFTDFKSKKLPCLFIWYKREQWNLLIVQTQDTGLLLSKQENDWNITSCKTVFFIFFLSSNIWCIERVSKDFPFLLVSWAIRKWFCNQ